MLCGIRFCGGCNPRYDRGMVFERIKKAFEQDAAGAAAKAAARGADKEMSLEKQAHFPEGLPGAQESLCAPEDAGEEFPAAGGGTISFDFAKENVPYDALLVIGGCPACCPSCDPYAVNGPVLMLWEEEQLEDIINQLRHLICTA